MRRRKYDKGRWQLEKERHQIDSNAPPAPDQSTDIGEVIPELMRKMGLQNRLWEKELIDEWVSLVGPQVAAHARPGRIDRKILYVFVSHPGWLSELSRYGQKEILKKLQDRFGSDKVKGIRLQLDPDQGKPR